MFGTGICPVLFRTNSALACVCGQRCFIRKKVTVLAFNGITTAALRHEIEEKILGGRIARIVQTESDEVVLFIRPEASRGGGQIRLLLSADASLPLCYLTEESGPAPLQAPAFCMLLRKHLQGGRITAVSQPGLERVLRIEVEHLNEMGDLARHTLVLELMGKYSNLILLAGSPANVPENPETAGRQWQENAGQDHGEIIVDSIKHVSSMISSVREVLPGRPYFIPQTQNKRDALSESREEFLSSLSASPLSPAQFLVRSYTGFSTVTGEELCVRAGIDADRTCRDLSLAEKENLADKFFGLIKDIREASFAPHVYLRPVPGSSPAPGEYSAFPLSMCADLESKSFASMSELLSWYYAEKNRITRIRQRTADLRHTVTTILERDTHKYDSQLRQLKDTEKRDRYRICGELLHTYGSTIPAGSKSVELDNYYTGDKIRVALDPQLTPAQNAKKYFDRYGKLKRTAEALGVLTKETAAEIEQLRNILVSLDLSAEESDIAQIREELEQSGLVRRHPQAKGSAKKNRLPKSRPFHYVSHDGYDIYVGKNNLQNDEITFHLAGNSDLWFHANDMPGSHVILKTSGRKMEEIPDQTFIDAASLAAHYSSGRDQGKVEVDYLYRRDVKKPAGAKPGFVVYYTNYSILAPTDISCITQVE